MQIADAVIPLDLGGSSRFTRWQTGAVVLRRDG